MVTSDSHVTSFKPLNISEQVWMWPKEWKQHHIALKKSHQYLQMKVKLYWTFESKNDAMQQLFPEMMLFP
jgi:hypothetical protein